MSKSNMEKMVNARIRSEVLISHLQHSDTDNVRSSANDIKTKSQTQSQTQGSQVQHVQDQTEQTQTGSRPRELRKESYVEDKESFLRKLIKKIVDEALEAALTSFTMHTASREYYVQIMGETIGNQSLVKVMQYINSAGDTAEGDKETRELAVKLLMEAMQKAMEYNNRCDYSKYSQQIRENMDGRLNRVTLPIHQFQEKLAKECGSPFPCEDTMGTTESEEDKELDEDICTGNNKDRNEDICSENKDEDIYADDIVGMAVYMLHCY